MINKTKMDETNQIWKNDNFLQDLLLPSRNKDETIALIRFLDMESSRSTDFRNNLLSRIDGSAYSTQDWGSAILIMLQYLQKNLNQAQHRNNVLSYLSCVAEAAAMQPILPAFSDLVDSYLAEHGFTAADT